MSDYEDFLRPDAPAFNRLGAQTLSDDQLIAKLDSLGISVDRATMDQLTLTALSSADITNRLLNPNFIEGKYDRDWAWICFDALWQRWFPDRPSFDSADDAIDEGYLRRSEGKEDEAVRVWLDAYRDMLDVMGRGSIAGFEALEEAFPWSDDLSSWIQEMDLALPRACFLDSSLFAPSIAFCEDCVHRFPGNPDVLHNIRRTWAALLNQSGDPAKAEALYDEWLSGDPEWGWGWIGRSDLSYCVQERQDLARTEQILLQGAAIPGVRSFRDIAHRLAGLYEEQGRSDEAQVWRKKYEAAKERFTPIGPIRSQKVGRNEPCPCGSGKKYKKCCRP